MSVNCDRSFVLERKVRAHRVHPFSSDRSIKCDRKDARLGGFAAAAIGCERVDRRGVRERSRRG